MSESRLPESWSELSSLIDALLDAPVDRRAALIEELSGGDPGRRSELERIVTDSESDLPLLDRPAAERFGSLLDDAAAWFPESLADRYRLTREVGRGGMATVYLAHDLKHARDVAVKVVHPVLASSSGGDRFLREIEIVARLHHPHIVPLYDSGEANGSLYYVMPYEDGSSLRHRMARQGALPIDEALLILRDVCDALSYAHNHGIVHRDIKPDNVLLSGRHAMVTDFGVAKALAPDIVQRRELAEVVRDFPVRGATTVGGVLGTPAYMAPEQITGDPEIDHRADLYAVGVVAYELLAGRPPFVGETLQVVLSAHLTEAPASLTTLRPDVPTALAELVMTCLAKRPVDRWQTAEELVHRLEHLTGSKGDATALESPRQWWAPTRARVIGAGVVLMSTLAIVLSMRAGRADVSWRNRWANARVERLTDFAGSEVDAAISRDGRFVAFLADRDSVFDAFVTEVGSGRFRNISGGKLPQLLNEDVRNVGFSGDGADVWVRVADIAAQASVSLTPTLGGPLRPFLPTAVMAVWSPDGSNVAYHETTPGDPIYIADRDGGRARRVFVAGPGVHNHHLSWSPNGSFLYFSHGLPPDEMDIWRIPVAGGPPERVTTNNSRVAYPVLLDERTLLYTATADDGTGPWLYSMDVERGVAAERVNMTVEHYMSIAASAGASDTTRRLVATVSNPAVRLWSVPITTGVAAEDSAVSLSLPTARAAAPRFGRDGSLHYLASRGGADGLWRLAGAQLAGAQGEELWKAADGAVVGAAAISPDGKATCFPVRRRGRSTLHCLAAEKPGVRVLAESLDVRAAASWSPDGSWIVVAAKESAGTRIFKVPAGGGQTVRLVDSVASNPVWSPDGKFIVYAGTPRARSVPVKAVTPDGRPYPFPEISVDRVGDSYRFLPDGKRLVVKLGGFRRQDFWLLDLATGKSRRLTSLRPGESLRRFDVSPDGRRIVFERVRENSDIALIELPRR